MAFDAGAAVAKVVLDDSEYKEGAKNIQTSTKGMAKSMFVAQAAFALASKAVSGIVNGIKKSVKLFVEQERVEKLLNSTLESTKNAVGLTADEIKTMASNLQDATTFGDEAIISGQNLLLTFTKIGKETFPKATETVLNMSAALGQSLKQSAIQVGKALQDPVQGVDALRRAGVQLSDEQKKQVKQFVALGDVASAQKIILGELEVQFGGAARAMRDTFGGAMISLQNVTGDIQEDIGRFVATVGKDVVENMIAGATAIRNFINSAEGIDIISNIIASFSAGIEITKKIIVGFGEILKDDVFDIIDIIIDGFKELTEELQGNISVFDILGGVLEGIGIALTIGVKLIKIYINGVVDMIIIVKEAITALVLFGQAIFQPKKWKEVGAQIKEIGTSIKKFGTDAIGNITDLVTSTIDQFAKLPENAKKQSKELEETWTSTFDSTKDKITDSMMGIVDVNQKGIADILGNIEQVPTAWENALEKMKIVNIKFKEGFDGIGKKVIETATTVLNNVAGIMNDIFGIVTSQLENELVAIEEKNAAELEELQMQKDNRLLNLEEELLTEEELLLAKKEKDVISQEQFDMAMSGLQKKRSDEKAKIEKEENEKIEAQKRKAQEKRNKKEQEIFNANKANQIANIWVQFAVGIVGLWAQSLSQLGPIAGSILAGIMTAALLGIAIAQTVTVSQQQFIPARQFGGAASGPTLVNEEGGEIVDFPDGSVVIPHDISKKIAMNAGGMGSGTVINVSFAGAKISDDMSLKKISDFVIRDMAKQLRLQT